MFEKNLFEGQRILITGGGTGLGLGMAHTLANLGAEVHIAGRRLDVLEEAAKAIAAESGVPAFAHQLDIRSAQAVDTVVGDLWAKHGPLTALINNAAGNFVSRTEDLSVNGFHAISDIVFRGTFYITQAVGKRWIAGELPGAVLSIVVTWIDTGSPFVVPSAMSKAGLDAMTKSLAVEWGPKGIRLNAIAPGIIPTQGASSRLRPGVKGNENLASYRELQNPTKRLGTHDDLGNLAAYMLAPENTWLNGQTITLDGGDALANGAYFKEYLSWDDAQWAEAKDLALKANPKSAASTTNQ